MDPSRLIALCALVIIHMLRADMLQANTRATPCSHPLQQRDSWHRQRHRHSYLSCALYDLDIFSSYLSLGCHFSVN